ncbi:DUF1707 domain-containing protein [Streptomyces sp. NPDC094438]|uniref:DUF1707 SHOCT-like domain-containing protein n=1 Tax=Streptomyces sp. NPDC094438 TaxID=3366061 RepID=UPI003804A002
MPGDTSSAGKPHDLGVSPAFRASHADRERTVDVLRLAAGDGRLTAAELDERLEAALTARTIGELAELTADLPPVTAAPDGAAVEVKDVARIVQQGGSVHRDSRWVVPRRLEIQSSWCDVTLDFTEAVITQDVLRIDMDMRGGTLLLVTGPGIAVNTESLAMTYGKVKRPRAADPGAPIALQIGLVGHISFGRVVVRSPRRTLRQGLLHRPG